MLGVDIKTVQRHLELFKGAFLLRELPLFDANLNKRLRKAPRLYFRDSGVLHALLMIRDAHQLPGHPQYRPSWEGFCIEQVIRMTRSHERQCFTWSLEQGPEVDLLLEKPQGRFGIECKAAAAPRLETSMERAVQFLGLKKLYVIHPGEKDYPLNEQIDVVAFRNLGSRLEDLV